MQKTIEFDAAGYIRIDGNVFEDPAEARKFARYGVLYDEQSAPDGAHLSARDYLSGDIVSYTADIVDVTSTQFGCVEYPSKDFPNFGNCGAFFIS